MVGTTGVRNGDLLARSWGEEGTGVTKPDGLTLDPLLNPW